jgi:hypothetical protein
MGSFSSAGIALPERKSLVRNGVMRLMGAPVLAGVATGTLDSIFGSDGVAYLLLRTSDSHEHDITVQYTTDMVVALMIGCWCGFTGASEPYLVTPSRSEGTEYTMWRCPSCGVNHAPADYIVRGKGKS